MKGLKMKHLKWVKTIRTGITFLLLLFVTYWSVPTNCVFATENQNEEAVQSEGQKEVRFYVRLDGKEQYENGSTHYDVSLYSPGIAGELSEIKQINSVADGKSYLQKIKDNIIEEPSVESFDISGQHYSSDEYAVLWYVIKEETAYWHVDGILVRKSNQDSTDGTAVTTVSKTGVPVTAMAQQKGTIVKTGDTQKLEIWLTLMCISAIALVVMIWKRFVKTK